MKTLLTLTVLCLSLAVSAKELKVLMIGNSFSQSVLGYLPILLKADTGNKLTIANAYIGGCTLAYHMKNIKMLDEKPDHKPYTTNYPLNGQTKQPIWTNVKEMLNVEKWDIITIQQGSPSSWQEAHTEPHATELIAYIRKFQPDAEIVIQQTWSYRSDNPRLDRWKMDQNKMYELLEKNYRALAERNKFRIIPMGHAVQLTRKYCKTPFVEPDAKAIAALTHPDTLTMGDDVVGASYAWIKNKEGKMEYRRRDSIHLNDDGEYLQACVWYMFLFDKTAKDIPQIKKRLHPERAAELARIAEEALKTYVQVKK